VTTPLTLCPYQQCGVSAQDCKRLAEAGFATIESVAFAPRKELVKINGLSENKVAKIQEEGENGM
jgi:DNA repair protein RAD51